MTDKKQLQNSWYLKIDYKLQQLLSKFKIKLLQLIIRSQIIFLQHIDKEVQMSRPTEFHMNLASEQTPTPQQYEPKCTNDGGTPFSQIKQKNTLIQQHRGTFSRVSRFPTQTHLGKCIQNPLVGPGSYRDDENFKQLTKKACKTIILKQQYMSKHQNINDILGRHSLGSSVSSERSQQHRTFNQRPISEGSLQNSNSGSVRKRRGIYSHKQKKMKEPAENQNVDYQIQFSSLKKKRRPNSSVRRSAKVSSSPQGPRTGSQERKASNKLIRGLNQKFIQCTNLIQVLPMKGDVDRRLNYIIYEQDSNAHRAEVQQLMAKNKLKKRTHVQEISIRPSGQGSLIPVQKRLLTLNASQQQRGAKLLEQPTIKEITRGNSKQVSSRILKQISLNRNQNYSQKRMQMYREFFGLQNSRNSSLSYSQSRKKKNLRKQFKVEDMPEVIKKELIERDLFRDTAPDKNGLKRRTTLGADDSVDQVAVQLTKNKFSDVEQVLKQQLSCDDQSDVVAQSTMPVASPTDQNLMSDFRKISEYQSNSNILVENQDIIDIKSFNNNTIKSRTNMDLQRHFPQGESGKSQNLAMQSTQRPNQSSVQSATTYHQDVRGMQPTSSQNSTNQSRTFQQRDFKSKSRPMSAKNATSFTQKNILMKSSLRRGGAAAGAHGFAGQYEMLLSKGSQRTLRSNKNYIQQQIIKEEDDINSCLNHDMMSPNSSSRMQLSAQQSHTNKKRITASSKNYSQKPPRGSITSKTNKWQAAQLGEQDTSNQLVKGDKTSQIESAAYYQQFSNAEQQQQSDSQNRPSSHNVQQLFQNDAEIGQQDQPVHEQASTDSRFKDNKSTNEQYKTSSFANNQESHQHSFKNLSSQLNYSNTVHVEQQPQKSYKNKAIQSNNAKNTSTVVLDCAEKQVMAVRTQQKPQILGRQHHLIQKHNMKNSLLSPILSQETMRAQFEIANQQEQLRRASNSPNGGLSRHGVPATEIDLLAKQLHKQQPKYSKRATSRAIILQQRTQVKDAKKVKEALNILIKNADRETLDQLLNKKNVNMYLKKQMAAENHQDQQTMAVEQGIHTNSTLQSMPEHFLNSIRNSRKITTNNSPQNYSTKNRTGRQIDIKSAQQPSDCLGSGKPSTTTSMDLASVYDPITLFHHRKMKQSSSNRQSFKRKRVKKVLKEPGEHASSSRFRPPHPTHLNQPFNRITLQQNGIQQHQYFQTAQPDYQQAQVASHLQPATSIEPTIQTLSGQPFFEHLDASRVTHDQEDLPSPDVMVDMFRVTNVATAETESVKDERAAQQITQAVAQEIDPANVLAVAPRTQVEEQVPERANDEMTTVPNVPADDNQPILSTNQIVEESQDDELVNQLSSSSAQKRVISYPVSQNQDSSLPPPIAIQTNETPKRNPVSESILNNGHILQNNKDRVKTNADLRNVISFQTKERAGEQQDSGEQVWAADGGLPLDGSQGAFNADLKVVRGSSKFDVGQSSLPNVGVLDPGESQRSVKNVEDEKTVQQDDPISKDANVFNENQPIQTINRQETTSNNVELDNSNMDAKEVSPDTSPRNDRDSQDKKHENEPEEEDLERKSDQNKQKEEQEIEEVDQKVTDSGSRFDKNQSQMDCDDGDGDIVGQGNLAQIDDDQRDGSGLSQKGDQELDSQPLEQSGKKKDENDLMNQIGCPIDENAQLNDESYSEEGQPVSESVDIEKEQMDIIEESAEDVQQMIVKQSDQQLNSQIPSKRVSSQLKMVSQHNSSELYGQLANEFMDNLLMQGSNNDENNRAIMSQLLLQHQNSIKSSIGQPRLSSELNSQLANEYMENMLKMGQFQDKQIDNKFAKRQVSQQISSQLMLNSSEQNAQLAAQYLENMMMGSVHDVGNTQGSIQQSVAQSHGSPKSCSYNSSEQNAKLAAEFIEHILSSRLKQNQESSVLNIQQNSFDSSNHNSSNQQMARRSSELNEIIAMEYLEKILEAHNDLIKRKLSMVNEENQAENQSENYSADLIEHQSVDQAAKHGDQMRTASDKNTLQRSDKQVNDHILNTQSSVDRFESSGSVNSALNRNMATSFVKNVLSIASCTVDIQAKMQDRILQHFRAQGRLEDARGSQATNQNEPLQPQAPNTNSKQSTIKPPKIKPKFIPASEIPPAGHTARLMSLATPSASGASESLGGGPAPIANRDTEEIGAGLESKGQKEMFGADGAASGQKNDEGPLHFQVFEVSPEKREKAEAPKQLENESNEQEDFEVEAIVDNYQKEQRDGMKQQSQPSESANNASGTANQHSSSQNPTHLAQNQRIIDQDDQVEGAREQENSPNLVLHDQIQSRNFNSQIERHITPVDNSTLKVTSSEKFERKDRQLAQENSQQKQEQNPNQDGKKEQSASATEAQQIQQLIDNQKQPEVAPTNINQITSDDNTGLNNDILRINLESDRIGRPSESQRPATHLTYSKTKSIRCDQMAEQSMQQVGPEGQDPVRTSWTARQSRDLPAPDDPASQQSSSLLLKFNSAIQVAEGQRQRVHDSKSKDESENINMKDL